MGPKNVKVQKFLVQNMWVQKNNGLKNVKSKRIWVKNFVSKRVRENLVVVNKDSEKKIVLKIILSSKKIRA